MLRDRNLQLATCNLQLATYKSRDLVPFTLFYPAMMEIRVAPTSLTWNLEPREADSCRFPVRELTQRSLAFDWNRS